MAFTFHPNTLHTNSVVGQVETCDFEMEDRHGSKTVDVHQSLQLQENGVTLFKGDVDECSVRSLESPYDINVSGVHTGSPVGARMWTIKGTGLTQVAYRILTGSFSAQAKISVALVVQTLATALGYATSIATYPSDMALPDSFLSDQEPLSSAFTRLADLATALSGIPHVWRIRWVNSVATFEFLPVISIVGNYGIGLGGYQPRANTIVIRRTREQFSNWVILKLDRYLKGGGEPVVDTFAGSALFQGTLALTAPCAGQPTVTVSGQTVQTLGIKNVDTGKDWYWSAGSNILTVGDSDVGSSDTITVTYPAQDLRTVEAKDAASIASVGPFQSSLQLGDSTNALSPQSEAQAQLYRRLQVTTVVKCQVRCPPDIFTPGQLVQVNLTAMGSSLGFSISGYYYLTGLRQFDEDARIIWRELEMVQGPQLYKAAQFLGRLTR